MSAQPESHPFHHPQDADEPRHQAKVSAEIRRLETTLWSLGPMPTDTLAHVSHADQWREGSFEEALREGVRQGRLERMPFGWVKAVKPR